MGGREGRGVMAEYSCRECGDPCFVDEVSQTSHHGSPDEIDYDADAEHVAIPEADTREE